MTNEKSDDTPTAIDENRLPNPKEDKDPDVDVDPDKGKNGDRAKDNANHQGPNKDRSDDPAVRIQDQHPLGHRVKNAISPETFVCLVLLIGFFAFLGSSMGMSVLMSTIMNQAQHLLLNTCFFIMAVAVLMGGLGEVMSEFGITELFNVLLAPLMRPLYGLPGVASLGVLTTFLSDNPAILSLASNKSFRAKFRRYQLPSLCNLGTSFGMGIIVASYMVTLGVPHAGRGVAAGILGTIVGSIISTRLMLRKSKAHFGDRAMDNLADDLEESVDLQKYRIIRPGNGAQRLMSALLEGGKSGVEVGLSIIPGVLIICTFVLLLTNGPDDPFPGVALIPKIGDLLSFILTPLFGFSAPQNIAVPLTALGSAGASLGLIPSLVKQGVVQTTDLAVFTAMCMCWSGYLSTHIAMMDSLDCRDLTSSAIISHTIGGLAAGISAHFFSWLFAIL